MSEVISGTDASEESEHWPAEPGEARINADWEDALDCDEHIYEIVGGERRMRLLTAMEEVRLAKIIEAGEFAAHVLLTSPYAEKPLVEVVKASDTELRAIVLKGLAAKWRMIEANIGLAKTTAWQRRRYQGSLVEDDLVHEGLLGVERAVQKFDYTQGYKFSTYATTWVAQFVDRAIYNKNDMVRKPVHVAEETRRIKRMRSELYQEIGAEPTMEEVAQRAYGDSAQAAKVAEMLGHAAHPVSLDQAVEGGDKVLGDFFLPHYDADPFDPSIDHRLAGILSRLEAQERAIIILLHGLGGGKPQSAEDVAERYGMDPDDVLKLEKRLVIKMRALAKEA